MKFIRLLKHEFMFIIIFFAIMIKLLLIGKINDEEIDAIKEKYLKD
jgi:hypothetical protein